MVNSDNSSIYSDRSLSPISISGVASDDSSDANEPPRRRGTNSSDASTTGSRNTPEALNLSGGSDQGGNSFGFSPQRSSGAGSNISLNFYSDSDSNGEEDNDELRGRRDLFNALALREPDQEEEEEARRQVSPTGIIEVLPPSPEGLFNFRGLLSDIGRGRERPIQFLGLPQTARRRRENSDELEETEPEEAEEEVSDDDDDHQVDVSRQLSILEAFRLSRNIREMSRVQGAAQGQGQGQGQGTSAGVPRASSAPAAPSSISYECSVCLENLDQPASIDLENNGEENDNEVHFPIPAVLVAARRGGGRGRGRLSQRNAVSAPPAAAAVGRGRRGENPVNLTDVVATHCGHLYHQVCLEKWFAEQG